MQEKKTISSTPVSLVLIGAPRSGKSTILQRLIEGVHIVVDPKSETTSTPLAGEPMRIEIKMRGVATEFAFVKEKKWIKHGYSGEKQLLVSYFLQKVPSLPQVGSKPDAILVRQDDHYEVAEPPKKKIHLEEAIEGHAKSSRVDHPPAASLEPAPIQQLPSPSLSSDIAFESPRDILNSGAQGVSLEEAEDDLEGSMMLHILDTGGQPEFLNVLPAILSGPSLSLLVFKLTDSLSERYVVKYSPPEGEEAPAPYVSSFTLEESLLQAYTSVSHRAPPQHLSLPTRSMSTQSSTMLVGTHKDRVSEVKIKEIDEQLSLKFKEVKVQENQLIERERYPNNPNAPQHVFAIDNTKDTDPGFPDLKEAIAIALEKHFSKLTLPMQWLMLYLAIKSTKKRVLSLEQCQSIASSCDITSIDSLKLALWYLSHQLGVFRYYPDVEGLQDTIICDLQVLFDCITSLIASVCYQKCAGREESHLRQSGRCSAALLYKLLHCSCDLSPETTIAILQHLRVVSRIVGATTLSEFFVPCVLRMFPVEMITATQKAHPSPLLITFERGYCPLGLFSQLIVYLSTTKGWELGSDILFRNIVTFHVGDDMDEITLIARPRFYEVLLEGEVDESREHPLSDSCSEICTTIKTAIDAVKSGLNSTIQISHTVSFYCSRRECDSSKPHPATVSGKKAVCSATRKPVKCVSSQQVWLKQCSDQALHPVQVSTVHDNLLEKDSLDVLTKELVDVRRWFDLGLLLGLSCSTLVGIKSTNWDNISGCRRDMISRWLKSHDRVSENGGPTVKSLVAALCNPHVGCPTIAARVEQRFQSTAVATSCDTVHSILPMQQVTSMSRMTLDDKPTMPQLLEFEGRDKTINIPREISTSYLELGLILLQDHSGAKIKNIEFKFQRDIEQINLSILEEWRDGQGLQPVTWGKLIEKLRVVNLNRLADDIEECFIEGFY